MPSLCFKRKVFNTDLILESDPKTDWKSIYIAALVAFIGCVHTQCLAPAVWPYMQVVIPGVSETFYGLMVSLFGLGMVVAGLLAGWVSNLLRNTTQPMLVAKLLALFSCLIYMSVEVFNESIRSALFLIFLGLLGLSSGAAQIYTAHVAMASTEQDRAKAVAICSLAPSLGMFIGPMLQVAFTALGSYPGIKLIFGMHLNMYTAPVYMVFVVSIIGTILLIFCFDGRMRLRKEEHAKKIENENNGNLERIKEINESKVKEGLTIIPINPSTSTESHASQSYDKLAICICLYIRLVVNLCLMMFSSVGFPYIMMAFGWTSKQSVLYTSICMILIGFNNCFWNVAYIFWDLKKRLSERLAILIGICFLLIVYLCTYPWPFIKETIPYKLNEINGTGCPMKYEWCAWTPKVNMWLFLSSLVIALGVGIPLCIINLDILFSKILGNIKQGTLQGVMIGFGSIANTVEPLALAKLYTLTGPIYIWQFELAIIIISIILWILFYKRMIGKTERLTIEQKSNCL